jgi:hypothetical protein
VPKKILATLIVTVALPWGAFATAQVVQPLGPPSERGEPAPGEPETVEGGVIPVPLGGRSAEAARAGTRVGSVLPPAWSSVAVRYQPLWDVAGAGAGAGFGLERWSPYFAASAIMPQLSPHPFLSPWGMLAYEGWLFDRYRAAWDGAPAADDRLDGAASWLQRGDRAMAEGRADDAALAYRRVTQAAPELPLGWLALGAALAEAADDPGAADALRQGFDRYPAWLSPALDWQALFGGADRLVAVQSAAAERAEGSADARFVAGVLHLFGGAPATGRRLLAALPGDPHAAALLARGPR